MIRRRAPASPQAERSGFGWSLALLLVAALFALPLVLMILAPLRLPGQAPPQGLELIPANPSLQSFRDAFALVPLGGAIRNSIFVALIAVPLTIVTASWGGLALTLLQGRARTVLIGSLLLLAMVPVTAVWIPRFALFGALGLVGTHVPLVAPALMGGNPLFVLLYAVALRRIPPELFEAARMEGAGILRIWRRVALPLVKPTTAAIALLALVTFCKQKDHMAKLTTGFSGGDPPDLFLINFRRYGQFAAKGVLEPIGPRLTERGQYREEDFYEPAVEAFRWNGTLTCAPQSISSLVVYYNRALFAAAGLPEPTAAWTWAEFLAAAKALTRDADSDGRAQVYGLGFEPTVIRLAPFVWQAGGELVDDLARPTRFTLDEPAAREALDFVRSWSATHKVVPPLVENKSEDHESRFARGGLGMILHSRRYTATLRTVQGLDWDVAPLPRHRQAATVLHADAYCLAKSSKRKDVAYQFVEFALSPEGAGIIARSGRTVPARKTVAEGPDFLDPNAPPRSARVFLDSIASIRRTPNIAAWNEIETRADPLVEEWYFSPTPPKKSLGQDLTEATQGLFAEPAPAP